MKLALLAGLAAAASLTGIAGARAADFYAQAAPDYVYTTPGYAAAPTYTPTMTYRPIGPAPFMPPGYVIAEPVPGYVVTEPQSVMVGPPAGTRQFRTVVTRPSVRTVVAPPTVIRTEPVTTGYSTAPSCFIDLAGFERCY